MEYKQGTESWIGYISLSQRIHILRLLMCRNLPSFHYLLAYDFLQIFANSLFVRYRYLMFSNCPHFGN